MTATVTDIRGEEFVTPADCHSMAADLRELAAQIDRGEIQAIRGVVVYQTADKRVRHIAAGDPLSLLEACGLMAWTIDDIKNR